MRAAAAVLLTLVLAQASAKNTGKFEIFKQFYRTDPDTGKLTEYTIVLNEVAWDVAEKYCQTEFKGHLAAPSTQAENEFIRNTFYDSIKGEDIDKLTMMWFGGFMPTTDWEFTNGEEMTTGAYVTGWSTTAPNGIAAQDNPKYADDRYLAYGGHEPGVRRGWVRFPQPGPRWPFICEA